MAIFLSEQDVKELVTMPEAIAALETTLRHQGEGRAVNEPRRRLRTGRDGLQLMPASDMEIGIVGAKISYYAGGKVHVLLYESEARTLVAVIEANELGSIRTGAASGVATKYMARPGVTSLGIIGAGNQARTQVEAVCAVMPIREVLVYSRNKDHRREFAGQMTERLGIEVRAVDAGQAVADADIVTTATNAAAPVLQGDWLREGAHVNAIGANSIVRRELDLKAVVRAGTIVVDDREQAGIECGDLLEAWERGIVDRARLPELGDVVAGHALGRASDEEITLFESQGIGLWDVALAGAVYRKAREEGRGVELPF